MDRTKALELLANPTHMVNFQVTLDTVVQILAEELLDHRKTLTEII